MSDLTDAEIAELRRLDAAARPAPWRQHSGLPEVVVGPDRPRRPGDPIDGVAWDMDDKDAALVAAARNALARLLAEIERHRANLKALESNLEHWPATYDTARTLSAIRGARDGFLLETLT